MAKRFTRKYPKDLTGQKFGRLSVICQGENYKSPKGSTISMWWCQCDCGSKPILLRRDSLTTENTQSCGCLQKEAVTIHRGTGTRLYQTWRNMINRCYREDTDSFYLYGAKGISVCDEWRNDFDCFRKWAYENGYNDQLTIERKDNTKNYCPENCKWVTSKEQSKHTSRNHYLSYNQYIFTISEWAEKMHISPSVVRYYANKYKDKAIKRILEYYIPKHNILILPKELKEVNNVNLKNNSDSNQNQS